MHSNKMEMVLILKLFPVLPINIKGYIVQIHGDDSQRPIIEIGCDSHSSYHRFYVRGNGIGIHRKYHGSIFLIFQQRNSVWRSEVKLIDILLVEDNPDHVILAKMVLEKHNVANNVYVAADGAEALDFIYHRGKYSNGNNPPRPGLILLDVKLPKVDGFEVLKQLKSDQRYCSIPIVMLTTSSRDEEVAKGYAEGANSYVTKPVKFTEFAEKVKNIGLYWGLITSLP